MTSQESMDTTEIPHTITYEGMNIHDVLSQTTNTELLQKLLDQGERPCCQCFILAARNGCLSLITKLLEIEPKGFNTQDTNGRSLLSYIAWQSKDLLQLLKMGANPVVSDIENVLERVIVNIKNRDIEVNAILSIVSDAGVKLEVINGVHILKLLASRPSILNHVLDLNISPNVPGIHDIMTNMLLNDNDYSCVDVIEILTKFAKSEISLVDDEGVTLLKYCSKNCMLVKILVRLGTPLQKPYIHDALVTLASVYVTMDDLEMYNVLETIVNNGHKLIDNEGTSLVKYCPISSVQLLLYLLRLGADPNVPEIHRHLGSINYTFSDQVKEILTIVAAAGVELVDENDCSLIKGCISNEAVYYLLKLGASPFHEGEYLVELVLGAIYNKEDTDIVKGLDALIESGLNIMKEDKHGCTFLCAAIKFCAERKSTDASLTIIRYLLDYPAIRDENFKLNCKSDHHPQEIAVQYSSRLRDNVIVDMILKSKFKDTLHVSNTVLKESYYLTDNKIYHSVDMSLISFFVNSQNMYHEREDIIKDIDYLCEHGFSINDPGISPLTVLLHYRANYVNFIEFLLQRGVNVEQTVLTFKDKNLQDLKETQKLPDALVMAATKGSPMEVMQLLAPHSASPPLALLLFTTFTSKEKKVEWFRVLLSLGRVPHGTQAYRAIREKVREMADIRHTQDLLLPLELDIPDQVGGIKSQEFTMFDVAHRSPLSLLELSRYAVRMCLADTAAASNTQSLPQLFKSLLPPGLTDQHIADKIEQVRDSEDKWLSNEDELLQNSPSLMFVKSVLNIPDLDERERYDSLDYGSDDMSDNYQNEEYDDYSGYIYE